MDDVDDQKEVIKTPKSMMMRIIPLGGDCSHCRALN